MECINCKRDFTAKKSNAKFCSSTCRSQYFKSNRSEAPVVLPVNNPAQPFGLMGLSGNPSFDYIFQKTERENESLKAENKQLRDKLEDQKEQYRDLKLKVDTEAKLLQADKTLEESKGLGGFVDKVTSNERLMGLAEKLLVAKFGLNEDGSEEDILEGVSENKMLLQTIVSLIQDKDQEFLAHFIKITQYFSVNPALLISTSEALSKKIESKKTA
jgi:hypothetical protein